ncbi:MAG: glycosyltransferase [Syntrophus sp. (in: bacteria)]
MNDLVSIIITSYNHAEYLKQRMESLLLQTYSPIEIIVIDDGSIDVSVKVLDDYKITPNVEIIALDKNNGYANACNLGVSLCRGEYVMFAECDDYNEPDHIEILMRSLIWNKTAGVAYCRSSMVDSHGHIFRNDFQNREESFKALCYKDTLIPKDMMKKFLLISCVIPNMSAALIKKECFNVVGGFNTQYKACADWDFWCRIAEHWDFFYVSKTLNFFRRHPTTVGNTFGFRTHTLEIFDILYKNYSRMNLNYSEKLKFKAAIGTLWGMHIREHPSEWVKSFLSMWRQGLKYDQYIIINLLLWVGKGCYEKIVKRLFLPVSDKVVK